jgi:hypothetical protein
MAAKNKLITLHDPLLIMTCTRVVKTRDMNDEYQEGPE